MKETVSKTAKKTTSTATPAARKSSVAAPAKAATAKAKATPASRPAAKAAVAKPAAKSAAGKAAVGKTAAAKASTTTTAATRAATAAAKPAARTAGKTAATKPAAKPAAAKTAAKPAATVVKPAASTPAKASTKATAAKATGAPKKPAPAASGAGKADTGARTLGVPGVTAELADKMETLPVVSKVTEVMTKTTKPNSAAHTEERILTEDEIRAMSDEDYMNPAQLAFFKAKLQALEKELLKNAGETTEHLRETVLVPDPADRATIEEEHALELRTRDRERKLLKKVQQSLQAIDAGEYGWCEETGEPIGIPRLIARPTATLSLEAQQRRELKQKLYGD